MKQVFRWCRERELEMKYMSPKSHCIVQTTCIAHTAHMLYTVDAVFSDFSLVTVS
jgi:hypothetical protein